MIAVKKIVLLVATLLMLPLLASATNYIVAKDGSGDYTTIQAASNIAQPGDTIHIRAGTYTETIRPAGSGSPGSPITYAKSGSGDVIITGVGTGVNLENINYIVIDGLRIEDVHQWVNLQSSAYNIIKNCYMRRVTGWDGIFMWQESNHNKILNNTLIAVCTGSEEVSDLIYCYGGCHYNVIEGNDVQYATHVGIDIQGQSGDSSFNVIRNNRVWNPWHSGIAVYPRADYSLVEGNIILDSGEDKANNWCGTERDRTMPRQDHSGIQLGSLNCIIRNNVLVNNGCMQINSYTPEGNPPGPAADASDNRIYHNTFHKNYYGPYSNPTLPVKNNIFKNNIFYNQEVYDLLMYVYDVNYYINNNIGSDNYYLGSNAFESSTLKLNPLFVNENAVSNTDNENFNPEYVHLQSNSPMIDAGEFLTTTTNSGSNSNTITVEDAGYFYDGWNIEGEEGDMIQIEDTTETKIARIVDIDYENNIINIDRSLSWEQGDGLSLVYSGSAPDIGAFEYTGSTPPPTCENCKSSPCNTYNDCATGTGTCYAGYYCCQGSCTETSTCSVCRTNPCDSYTDCTTGTGTCKAGYYCCSGTCTEAGNTCSQDGTPYNQCSTNKPLYCIDGNLINKCSVCGCLPGQTCQADGTCQGEPIPGLSWEAEDGTITSPFEIGNGYIYQELGCVGSAITSCGKASYVFNIDNAGDYTIKAVVDAADTARNSFFVNIDAEPADPYMIWDIIDYTIGFEERTVSWRGDGTFDNNEFVPKTFTLSTGQHELIIRGREGQTLLDKIIIEAYEGGDEQCVPGDIKPCNGAVDIFDLTFVTSHFGLTSSENGWDSRADLIEPNGIIDIFDVVFVASRIS